MRLMILLVVDLIICPNINLTEKRCFVAACSFSSAAPGQADLNITATIYADYRNSNTLRLQCTDSSGHISTPVPHSLLPFNFPSVG